MRGTKRRRSHSTDSSSSSSSSGEGEGEVNGEGRYITQSLCSQGDEIERKKWAEKKVLAILLARMCISSTCHLIKSISLQLLAAVLESSKAAQLPSTAHIGESRRGRGDEDSKKKKKRKKEKKEKKDKKKKKNKKREKEN